MKKSSKPLIIVITSFLILLTIIVLVSQALRLKYEEGQRELAQLEKQIRTQKNQLVSIKANYQMLTAEDVIKNFAVNELGLITEDGNNPQKINLSLEEITDLSRSVEQINE
jgi:cell division protein FtsB